MTESLRCPFCGREDVDRIIFGLVPAPDPDAAMEHIRFGGCIVMAGHPDFHCNDCGSEWADDDSPDGRQRPTAEGEPDPYDMLLTLNTWIHHADGSSVEVAIDLQHGRVHWAGRTAGPDGQHDTMTKSLDAAGVEGLRNDLRRIDPLRWKGRYHAPCVTDATTWGVRLTTATRTSRRVGINAGPRGWDRLQDVVEQVVGRPLRTSERLEPSSLQPLDEAAGLPLLVSAYGRRPSPRRDGPKGATSRAGAGGQTPRADSKGG